MPVQVVVWPAWQRMLHWLLAAAVVTALVTFRGGALHEAAGYAALAAAVLRIGLGFAGPAAARFGAFLRGPRAVLAHAGELVRGNATRHLNHTPLGGWMIVALLSLAALGGGAGALYVTDRFWGVDWVIALHRYACWPLVALVPLHVAGVIHASVTQRENLVRAMLDGRKRRD
jgi:cytochrome b